MLQNLHVTEFIISEFMRYKVYNQPSPPPPSILYVYKYVNSLLMCVKAVISFILHKMTLTLIRAAGGVYDFQYFEDV
jgi:hypothetical protein